MVLGIAFGASVDALWKVHHRGPWLESSVGEPTAQFPHHMHIL